jgi:hypothetical protein
MSPSENPDPVQPALRQAEAELAQHLEEACEETVDRDNIAEESTDELLRLEEELLAAARAAGEAVKLRQKLGEGKEDAEKQSAAAEPAPADRGGGVREFRTGSGSEWRVWEVRPGAGGRATRPGLYPVDYAQGWLAFELLTGEGRKRLPKFAPEWRTASEADLERLLDQAVDVPKRKERSIAPDPPPPGL